MKKLTLSRESVARLDEAALSPLNGGYVLPASFLCPSVARPCRTQYATLCRACPV